jgi:hypothetical protein
MISARQMKKNEDIFAKLLAPASKVIVVELAEKAIAEKAFFNELLAIYNGTDFRLTQRVAWVFSYLAERNPTEMRKCEQVLLNRLQQEDATDAIKRNTMRIWAYTGLSTENDGLVFDICISYLMGHEAVAIKAHAMSVAYELAKPWPELRSELKVAIEDLYERESHSAGIRSKCKRTLADLAKF